MTEQIDIKNQEALNYLGQMDSPIPGQSLTADPDNPYPWERPPTHTTLNSAVHALFDFMTDEETYIDIVTALGDGMPVGNLAETILQDGASKGAWNTDLMLLLAEPTMYMLMSMAEKAGVKYRIDDEDDPEIEEASPEEELSALQDLNRIARDRIEPQNPSSKLPQEIQQELEQMEVPDSLLSKPEKAPEEPSDSLLSRGQ
tara:strand:+ start:677 stop:1279 length:603 start_codon:yes stop_codon:yes gene_type:complete